MSTMTERYDLDDAAHVIGRLILAAADDDEAEVRRCIGQYDEWGDVGSFNLVTDLATFGAGAAELLKGARRRPGAHLVLPPAEPPLVTRPRPSQRVELSVPGG